MKDYIEERAMGIANYIIENQETLRIRNQIPMMAEELAILCAVFGTFGNVDKTSTERNTVFVNYIVKGVYHELFDEAVVNIKLITKILNANKTNVNIK